MKALGATAVWTIVTAGRSNAARAQAPHAIEVVTDEADAALAILETRNREALPSLDAWQRLFHSEGYRRLARREAAMGRPMTDASFAEFLSTDSMAARASGLRAAVLGWRNADLAGAMGRALAYLPSGAKIRARIYPLIKPHPNSFVFEAESDPAIMLYLNPAVSQAKFENTVVHELHHIGYASACAAAPGSDHPSPSARAQYWMNAFGEGFAMLAAAGGPNIHPHATSDSAERKRWDRDIAMLRVSFAKLQAFFRDVVEERVTRPDSIEATAMSFFGIQGPWYTVGWAMARTIEARDGRAALLAVMCRPADLMRKYNQVVAQGNTRQRLPRWSESLLQRLRQN